MEFYVVIFFATTRNYYTIWFSDKEDGFIVESGKVKFFETQKKLEEFCIEKAIKLEKDVSSYDIVKLENWIRSETRTVDCRLILKFWNIIADLSKSLEVKFSGDDERLTDTYTRLFYGNNLPVLNDTDVLYVPVWSDEELNEIQCVMVEGLEIINEAFGIKQI